MKAVLDTNVVVSGVLTAQGTCGRILDLLVDGAFPICADDRILAEYEDVLARPGLRIDPADARAVLALIRIVVELVAGAPLSATFPDPADAPFLEVAAAGDAVLVTGNLRHYPKRVRGNVTVLRPAEFLDVIRRASRRRDR